jgi:hypothetical protein
MHEVVRLTVAIEAVSDLRSNIREEECLVHGILRGQLAGSSTEI